MLASIQQRGLCRPQNVNKARSMCVKAAPDVQQVPATTSSGELRNAGPEPQRFTVADGQLYNVVTSALPALLRLGSGGLAVGYSVSLVDDDGKYAVARVNGKKVLESSTIDTFPRPSQPLQLYEFEGCPFCKKVREAMSTLDLDVEVYPCPKDGTTWRPKAIELGGKKQFPYLVDPNTGMSMYESDEIIGYVFRTYGPRNIPLPLALGALTNITCALGMAPRSDRGNFARKTKVPEKPLVFYGYEMSPFVKPVREVLCELELPYLYRTTPRGSAKRQELLEKRGHFQVPYLEDPNQGVYLFESAAIVEYLEKTYGA